MPSQNQLLPLSFSPLSPTDAGCYPATAQDFVNLIALYGFAVSPISSNGQSSVNIGPNNPSINDIGAPWFNTTNNQWYDWNGSAWVVAFPSLSFSSVSGGNFFQNYNFGNYAGGVPVLPSGFDPAINVESFPWFRTNADGTYDSCYTWNTANATWLTPIDNQIGDIKMFATIDTPGLGWILYAAMEGVSPVGVGGTLGLPIGGTAGQASITLGINQLPSHTHGGGYAHNADFNSGGVAHLLSADGEPQGSSDHRQTGSTGGGASVPTLPPVSAVYFYQFTGDSCIIINNVAYRNYTQSLYPAT